MGIFDFFLSPSRKSERNPDRAEALLKVLVRPQDPPKSREVEKALVSFAAG